jgi:ribose transport system substrate-binding protein
VEVVKPAIRSANDAGIPVIVVNLLNPIEGVEVASYIGFSNVDAGAISGYATVDYLGGPGVLGEGEMVEPEGYLDLAFWEDLYADVDPQSIDVSGRVAIIEGIAGGFFSRQRLEGFHGVVDEYPGIEILTTLPADWNRQKAVSVTEDILQSHDNIDVIWAASNEMGIGATIPIQQQGLEDEIAVITNDGTPESVDMIRAGELLAETWHGFPEWGWYGTRFAVRAALGLSVPQQFDIRPRIEYEDNADEFYPNVSLEEHDWEGIIEEYQNQ